jgi:Lrp/AsnC family leucine-responsive transcriptional regulator
MALLNRGSLKPTEIRTRLDEVDAQILRILQRDGRTTNAELARRVGLSPPSVLQRVRKLEECGLIKGYMALIDQEKVGFKLQVIAMVSLALHQEQPIERFRQEVAEIEEVLECLHVSGDFDFLLKVVVPDMSSYEKLVREKLSSINGVGKIQSCFVLAVNKQTTRLPI